MEIKNNVFDLWEIKDSFFLLEQKKLFQTRTNQLNWKTYKFKSESKTKECWKNKTYNDQIYEDKKRFLISNFSPF